MKVSTNNTKSLAAVILLVCLSHHTILIVICHIGEGNVVGCGVLMSPKTPVSVNVNIPLCITIQMLVRTTLCWVTIIILFISIIP